MKEAAWQKILRERAVRTLEANLVETERGLFLAAGARQFRSLWVRDFCFSVPGLLSLGWQDLVQRQLLLYLSFLEHGALPRGADVVRPTWRVLWACLAGSLPLPGASYQGRRLCPERLGEHGTPAFDSNLLFLRAWAQIVAAGGDWGPVAMRIPELLQPYTDFVSNGVLNQPAFSDWQDSARREGAILFTHLLLWEVCATLADVDLLPAPFTRFEAPLRHLLRERYDPRTGLFREMSAGPQVALDSHLLLLQNPHMLETVERVQANDLFHLLKFSPAWGTVPGIPVFPPYDQREISWTTRVAGLRHYHDGFVWGWLVAESARVAFRFDDRAEGDRLLQGLSASGASPDDTLAEIFEQKGDPWRPVRRRLYRTETCFTWTAAKALEALAAAASSPEEGYL